MLLRKLVTTLVIPLTLISVLFVSGCDDFVANSAGVWAKIEVGPAPALSPEGQAAFNAVAKQFPEDAKKIIGRNNELVAKIEEYNRQARKHNRELYEKIHMDPKKIDILEP
jgi:hypothetical protein